MMKQACVEPHTATLHGEPGPVKNYPELQGRGQVSTVMRSVRLDDIRSARRLIVADGAAFVCRLWLLRRASFAAI